MAKMGCKIYEGNIGNACKTYDEVTTDEACIHERNGSVTM